MFSVLDNSYKNIDRAFEKFPELESKRFYLKEIKEENFNDIYNIFLDDDVMKFSGINIVEPFKQTKNYLKIVSFMYKKKQGMRWGIYDKINDDFVGDIGIFNIDRRENSLEIGCLIAKNYWRKGIGTECSREVIDFVFDELGVEKIIAIIDKENLPSINLVKKLSFKLEYEFTQLAFKRFKRGYYRFSVEK